MITFTQLLIYDTIALILIFYVLLLVMNSSRGQSTYPISPRVLKALIVCLLLAYVASQLVSLLRGYRDPVVFGLISVLSILMVFHVLINGPGGGLIPISLLLVSLSEPLTLYIGNDFYPRWNWTSDTILRTGFLNEYFHDIISAGLYYLIPVSYLRQVMLALVCQPSHVTRFINAVAEYLVYTISLYAFFKRSRFGTLAGVISVLILISSPGDNVLTGRLIGSFIFPFMLSSLIYYRTGQISALISSTLFMVGMVFQHGSPVVGYLLLFFPVLLRGWDEDLGLENASRRVGVITVILFAVALIYWVYTHIVMKVSHTGISFLESIIGYLPVRHEAISPWTYVPRYESGSSESYLVYSYAWAFPVAVSTALLLSYLTRVLTRRNKESSQIIGVTSAFLATTIVGAGFLAYKVSESGQYFIPLGYFLAMISSTIALSRILERNLKASFTALILLALFIYTGTSSPSHANLEHPEFESAAKIHRHTRYIEASLVSKMLDPQSKVYYDYDLPISGGIYKTIRERLYLVLQGYDPRALDQGDVIYAIKNARLNSKETIFFTTSVIYRSDYYTLFYVVS